MRTHDLSQHVHRIGYHFPSAVVAAVCMELGLYLTATGKALPFQGTNVVQPRHREDPEMSQVQINTEARDVLKDLFPGIPDNDLNQIIKTAFQKGQRKVGTAVELPLARRAQLAVVAHIRHVYTDYDKLLKATSFHEARSLVEDRTLAKLVEWRGDDENGKTVLEDVFREVIVISDDEDDSDAEDDVLKPHDRDYSVEVISSKPRVEVLQPTPINHANTGSKDSQPGFPEDDAPSGFRVIPRDNRRKKVDRRGFSRYQAWDRAINQYRNFAKNSQEEHMPPRDPNRHYNAGQLIQAPIELGQENFPQRTSRPRHVSVPPHGLSNSKPNRPDIAGFKPPLEHHKLFPVAESPYEKQAAPLSSQPQGRSSPYHENNTSNHRGETPNAPVFVSGPKEVHQKSRDYFGHYPRTTGLPYVENSFNPQDRVLPSIEAPPPAENKTLDNGSLDHLSRRMLGDFSIRSMSPHHALPQETQRLPHEISTGEQSSKRRRMAYYDQAASNNPRYDTGSTTTLREPNTGTRYVAVGRPLPGEETQDGAYIDVRKRWVSPRLPPSTVNVPPRTIAEPSYRKPYDLNGQVSSLPPHPQALHHKPRISERVQAVPITRHPPLADGGYNAVAPVPTTTLREPAVYRSSHRPGVDKLPAVPGLPVRRNPDRTITNERVLVPQDFYPKRHYAEDFVRAVDIREPIPVEPPKARLPASRVPGGRDLPTTSFPREAYTHVLPSRPPDHRHFVRSSALGHTTVENSYGHTQPGYATSVRHYERRPETTYDFPRPLHEVQPLLSTAREPPRPMYVRTLDRPRVQSSLPEERPIIIVD
ncbi:hypothetical protein BDV59DRAFT_133381 [Aspergillus ambiguus]|uniref:uncharacterized protein n=1 Tax=Aspergillus ambiguus TaxID=176160 RepID=UPI003CCCD817